MTTAAAIGCPHCGRENASGAAFCESCGKALPSVSPTGPQVVSGERTATSAGQNLIAQELAATTKRAATALMWVAILQTFFGPVVLLIEKSRMERENPGMEFQIQPIAYVIIFGVALTFWGLFIWARRSPLPAAIVGLVLFLTLHIVDAVMDPTSLVRGWLVKIVVTVVLCKAISAGLKHRRLMSESR